MDTAILFCVVLFIGFVCWYHSCYLQESPPDSVQLVEIPRIPRKQIDLQNPHSLPSSERNPWPTILPKHMREHTSIPVTHTKFRWNSQSIQDSETDCKKDFLEVYDNPTVRHGLYKEHPQNWLHGMPNSEIKPMNTN